MKPMIIDQVKQALLNNPLIVPEIVKALNLGSDKVNSAIVTLKRRQDIKITGKRTCSESHRPCAIYSLTSTATIGTDKTRRTTTSKRKDTLLAKNLTKERLQELVLETNPLFILYRGTND